MGVHRHNGPQGVVVPHRNLCRSHGVVLVDNRQSSQVQQTEEGVLEIHPPVGVLHVRAGQQDLGHRVVVFREQLVVNIHQLALSHRRQSLLSGNIRRLAGHVQLADAHGDCAGRHQHQLVSRVFQVAHDLAQQLHPPDIQLTRAVGQGGGA